MTASLLRLTLFCAALLPTAALAQATDPPTAPERPNFFGLYPPPAPGKVTLSSPPPSTFTRRPDLFAPLLVYPRRDTFLVGGAIDVRYRASQRDSTGSYVASSRLTFDYIRANAKDGDERGGVRLQGLLETPDLTRTRLNRLRLSEAYVFYKFLFPGVSASLRGGQFVLPFGLAAVYDTPLQPIQPLYALSLGLRVDTGVMLEGTYGPYRYAAAVTTGAGPNRPDPDGRRLTTFRLERNFLTQSGRIQIGGSLLSGRAPVTEANSQLPASGTSSELRFVDKTRFAADASYALEKLIARGEIVFGADDQNSVYGYFGEATYPVASRLTAVGAIRRWNFPEKAHTATTLSAGVHYELGLGLTLRTLLEYERDTPGGAAARTAFTDTRIVLQTRFDF